MENCVLCPTDFSDNAKNATQWACQIARKKKVPVWIYNCYHIPVIVNDIPFPMGTEVNIEEGLIELMKSEAQRLKYIYPDVDIQYHVEPGFVNESILEFARAKKASLIVMGITGRGKTNQFLIGSTAVSVSVDASIPVMIVPEQAHISPLKRIAVASDFHNDNQIVDIAELKLLVDAFDSYVEVVHIRSENEPTKSKSLKAFDGLNYTLHDITYASFEEGITDFAKNNLIDMVVIIHKKHTFFERLLKRSHTNKLAFATNHPVLVLHE